MKVHSEMRKQALREFNANVEKLVKAVVVSDYDAQLAYMTQAIESLQAAKQATQNLHYGVSN